MTDTDETTPQIEMLTEEGQEARDRIAAEIARVHRAINSVRDELVVEAIRMGAIGEHPTEEEVRSVLLAARNLALLELSETFRPDVAEMFWHEVRARG